MWRLTVLCVIAFACAPGVAAGQEAPAARTLSGVVKDAATGAAVPGARVFAVRVSAQDISPIETRTDGDGGFVLPGLRAGRYRLSVSVEGFDAFEHPHDVEIPASGEVPALTIPYPLHIQAEAGASANVPVPPAVPVVAGTTMTTLQGRAIVVAPGTLEDIMRVFQSRPGVAASQDDRNDMLVRGGGSIENATRVDGFDVPNPSHFGTPGASGGGFSFLAPWLIDQTVLRAGGFSVAFGERSSSVLDITLRNPAKGQVRGQVGASVGGAMGEAEGGSDGGTTSWLVSARRSFLSLVFDRGGDQAVPTYADLIGRFTCALSPRHNVELFTLGAHDDVDVLSSDGTESIEDHQTVTLGGLSLVSRWSPRWSSSLHVSVTRSSIDAVMKERNLTDGSDRSTEGELRARGEVRMAIGSGELMGGVAVKHADLDFNLDAKSFRDDYNTLVAALHSHFPYTLTDTSVYAEARLPGTGRVALTPGVRRDRIGTTNRFYTSPRLNVEYPVGRDIRFTGALGVYRQTIPYIWIGSDKRNAGLDPVKSVQALAGVSWRVPGNIPVTVEWFNRSYTGYPVDRVEPWHVLVSASTDYESPFVGQLDGSGEVRARGVDASARRTFGRAEIGGSYSLWHVTQLGLDRVWRRGDYDIRHQVRLDLAYDIAGRWRAAGQFRYASGRPYTPFDIAASFKRGWQTYDRAKLYTLQYPSYQRLDARIDRTLAVGRTLLHLYFEIENLYNHDNVRVYDLSWSTKQTKAIRQWGRLPVAGLRWEF